MYLGVILTSCLICLGEGIKTRRRSTREVKKSKNLKESSEGMKTGEGTKIMKEIINSLLKLIIVKVKTLWVKNN